MNAIPKAILPDGSEIPRLGQGTWRVGENTQTEETEIQSLRTGIELGLGLIDTAEMYGEGSAEAVIGKAIQTVERESLYLVSKVYPQNAGRRHMFESCENSLKRLGTDCLDLYLLHWPGSIPLEETVECMEELVKQGKIKRWGVSNFDVEDMEALFSVPNGNRCAINQVLYHLGSRGIEFDLLPWMRRHKMPVMAYCPIAQAGALRSKMMSDETVVRIANEKQISVVQLLLAFVLSQPDIIAIPKAANPQHMKENAAAAGVMLTDADKAALDAAFPAPTIKTMLDIQ